MITPRTSPFATEYLLGFRPIIIFLLLASADISSINAAETTGVSSATTTSSDLYSQVTCTTTNPALCADILQIAADARDRLTPLLRLGKTWRFPVHIHLVTPDDSDAATVHQEGVAVIASDRTLRIEAVLPSSDVQAREFILQQFVTALLWEKFFPPDQKLDTQTRLDVVPLWLIEGLAEWLSDDTEHNREGIVKRASTSNCSGARVWMLPKSAERSTGGSKRRKGSSSNFHLGEAVLA